MAIWIMDNLGTIIVTILLVLVVGGIIFSLIRKKGRSCCGGGEACPHCRACAAGRTEGKA